MPFVTCPNCDKKVSLGSMPEGSKIRCPACKELFRPPVQEEDEEVPPPRRPRPGTDAAKRPAPSRPAKVPPPSAEDDDDSNPPPRNPAKPRRSAPPPADDDDDDQDDAPAESGEGLFSSINITADAGAQVKAEVELKCWKEHTCALCKLPYRYLFVRQFSQKGASEEEAREKADAEAKRLLAEQSDYRPCPGCGLVQPAMVGTYRARFHVATLLAVLAVFVVVIVLAFYDLVSLGILQWVVGLTALGALVCHVLAEQRSHNTNLESNQQRSLKMMEDNELIMGGARYRQQADAQGWHAGLDRLFRQSSAWWVFAMLLLATCLVPVSEVLRAQRPGGHPWPKNDGLWWIFTFSNLVVLCTAAILLMYRGMQLEKRGVAARVFTFGGTLVGERPSRGRHNTLTLSCPGCQRTLRFAKELAGEKALCPACGRYALVQQGHAELEETAEEQEAAAERARTHAKSILAELPSPLPGKKKLGKPKMLYKADPVGEWTTIVLGAALGLGVPMLLLVNPWNWPMHPAWLGTLCFAAFAFGLYLAYTAHGHLYRRVAVFRDGMVDVHRGKVDVIFWADIDSFNQSITHFYTNFIYTGTTQKYTLTTHDGTKRVFNERLINVRLLGEEIDREMARVKLPEVLADFESGARLQFGPFSVDRRGLNYAGGRLSWSEVESVKVEKGAVLVARKGKWMSWATVPVADVANVMIFLVLTDAILNQQQ